MSMLAPFSVDTYLPSFPAIQSEFLVGQAAMQQTLSLYLVAFAFTTLIYGPLSDAFGRRPVVIGGLVLYVLTSIGCALAPDYPTLLAMRIGQGLTASAGIVVGRAVVRDAFAGARAQQVMARVMLIFALAPAVAPIVGGVLHAAFGWRAVFWLLAVLGALVALLAWRCMPETLAADQRQSVHPVKISRQYGMALSRGGFMVLVISFAFAFAGMFLYIAGAPLLVFEHLGLGPEDFAVVFLPLVGGVMTGTFLSGQLAHRLGPLHSVHRGMAVLALAALLNAAARAWLPLEPWTVIGPLALYAGGMAFALPALTVLALDYFPRNRGMASAVQSFVQTGGNALVAGLVVPLVGATATAMAGANVVFAAIALLLWAGWRRFESVSRAVP